MVAPTILKLRDGEIRKILAFDLEWSLDKDENGEHRILAAGFCNSEGNKKAFITDITKKDSNWTKDVREKNLLKQIVREINKYDWSIGFYSTGIRAYSPVKKKVVGRDSDLIQLHRRLERFHINSPIRLGQITGIPYIAGENNNHTHLDAYRIFSSQVIRTSVYNNAYNSNDLDTISKAILGDDIEFKDSFGSNAPGKYKGLSGVMFESLTSDYDKEQYVLQDAVLLMYCISHNNYEILKVMNSLAKLTGLSFRDVCNSKGVTKIWTPILDSLTEKEINILDTDKENEMTRVDTLLQYFDKKMTYEKKKELNKEAELEEAAIAADDETEEEELEDKKKVRYIGGWVMAPKPGQYKNVSVFDITSLYPTMIVNNNISFETIDCICCNDTKSAKIPDYIFDKESDRHICVKFQGVLTRQIAEYMEKRIEYKHKAKQLVNDNEYTNREDQIREYEIISNAYKILINSAYGQLGHKFSKYENVIAAELVTRYGRATIQYCAKIAKEIFKWDVIYSDTDSLFVNDSEKISKDDIDAFIETCYKQTKVNMELDKVYEKLLITGAKNYVGVTKDSKKLVVKGLAGKKSDRCVWVRNAFKAMLEDYKNNVNPCIRLRQEIEKLESGTIEDGENQLIIYKNLNKNVDEYKVNVVQKLIGIEKHLEEGDTIRYYIADSPKKYTYSYKELSKKEYKKQLINTVKPVIAILGYSIPRELERSAAIPINDIKHKKRVSDKCQGSFLIQV